MTSPLPIEKKQIIIETALMVAGKPLSITHLQNLFHEDDRPNAAEIRTQIDAIKEHYEQRGLEIKEIASGFRLQAKAELSPWLSKLWEEKAPKYSRAFLETLAIIAYKQPVTRAEIEEIRGVTISSQIIKTMQEREWIRILGHREIPGRPALFGTTKQFLDYFNLTSLNDLPNLPEFKALDEQDVHIQLAMEESQIGPIDSQMLPSEKKAIEEVAHEEEHNNIVPFECITNKAIEH